MKNEQDFKNVSPAEPNLSEDQNKVKIENSREDSSTNTNKEPGPALNSQTAKNKSGKVIPLDPEKVNTGGPGRARNRLMIIVMCVLTVILISVLADSFGLSFWSKPNQANAAVESTKKNDIETPEIQWKIPEKVSDDVRDVTGKTTGFDEDGKIIVQGIICSDHSRLAMISGQIIKEGNLIMGCRVLEVKRNAVVFQKDGKTWSQTVE